MSAPDPRLPSLLEPGERVLWQGAPVGGLHHPFQLLAMALFGLPFLAFGLGAIGTAVWMLTRQAGWQTGGGAVLILLFGLPFVGIGLLLSLGATLDQTLTAPRRLLYILTNRRALILTRFPKQRVESYPIRPGTPLVLEETKRAGTIWFHVTFERDSEGTSSKRHGFENIADAPRVFRLMRQVEAGEA